MSAALVLKRTLNLIDDNDDEVFSLGARPNISQGRDCASDEVMTVDGFVFWTTNLADPRNRVLSENRSSI